MSGAETGWDRYRRLFPVTKKYLFLNHAAVSATSIPVVQAMTAFWGERTIQAGLNYPGWMEQVEHARKLCAELIGCFPDEIAFTSNTSHGLSAIAAGLQWKPGDAVLVSSPDFPSMQYAWQPLQKKGVRIVPVKRRQGGHFGVREVEQALVPGTRLLAVSSVDFATGFHVDLKSLGEFCRRKSMLFCVDAIQSLGVLDMDMKAHGIHFLASGGHKWLMGPMGMGVLCVDRSVADLVDPVLVGWKSVINETDFTFHYELKKDARKFEPGTQNLSGILGLGAAVQLLLEIGMRRIEK
ncbi:MAG: aminotransferase class V-fold PLP-dependent enzyme, partial [Desulfovibrionales bacterium]